MGDLILVGKATLVAAAPLILGALGALLSERAGVMNIAIEGKMLMAACTVAIISVSSGSAVIGLFAGIAVAILLSALHWLLTQRFNLDHIISGMALNVMAIQGSAFFGGKFIDRSRTGEIPQLPIAVFYACAYILPILLAAYLGVFRGGLRLRAVGEDPDKAREAGIKPQMVRFLALIGTGLCTGLAGAMIVTNAGNFTDNMTSGRGYIALAALILGGWRPVPTLLGCMFFALFDAVQLRLQGGAGLLSKIPSEYWNSLPYVVTILALAFIGKRTQAPSGLGKP